jgi:hypothetical protein
MLGNNEFHFEEDTNVWEAIKEEPPCELFVGGRHGMELDLAEIGI